MLTIHAVGGLCNRLRAILSYPRPLTVRWDVDLYVNWGTWFDVFHDVEGVTIWEDRPERWDIEDFAPYQGAKPGWEAAYKELRLVREVAQRVAQVRRDIGWPYDAIHVRRLDHVPNAKRDGIKLTDDDFERFTVGDVPVYIATDNEETHLKWRQILGSRARVGCTPKRSKAVADLLDHRRYTSLPDAVVDLWVCAGARRFLGTPGSSFSDTIEILRSLEVGR